MRDKRPVALLDVDDTLLFGDHKNPSSRKVNTHLLDSLFRKGIKDVYLFTDMAFDIDIISDRTRLIENLRERGFRVHGVITPNDITWRALSDERIRNLGITGAGYGTQCETLLRNNPTMLKYDPSICRPGEAFEAAANLPVISGSWNPSIGLHHRSMTTRAFATALSNRFGYRHVKALMLDLFLCHKPNWVSSIVVADDRNTVISTLEDFRPIEGKNMPLLSLIKVNNAHMLSSTYDSKLEQHFQIAALNMVKAQIKNLKSGFNPFKSSASLKVEAFEKLQEQLSNNKTKKVSEVVQEWSQSTSCDNESGVQKLSVAARLAEKRGFFSCFNKETTSSSDVLRRLQEQSLIEPVGVLGQS